MVVILSRRPSLDLWLVVVGSIGKAAGDRRVTSCKSSLTPMAARQSRAHLGRLAKLLLPQQMLLNAARIQQCRAPLGGWDLIVGKRCTSYAMNKGVRRQQPFLPGRAWAAYLFPLHPRPSSLCTQISFPICNIRHRCLCGLSKLNSPICNITHRCLRGLSKLDPLLLVSHCKHPGGVGKRIREGLAHTAN